MVQRTRRIPWLTSGDRLTLGVAIAALLAALSVHVALRRGVGRPPARLTTGPALRHNRIDINAAEWWQLQALYGIGPTRARDIVTYRQAHGGFESVDALTNVPGIGPKTVDRLRPFLVANRQEQADAAQKDQ
jgi:competence ComEA-like helix-hairpin-helix protein